MPHISAADGHVWPICKFPGHRFLWALPNCNLNPAGIEITQTGVAPKALPWVRGPNDKIYPERVESWPDFDYLSRMSQSLAKILVHTVFSTKDRRPFLRDATLRQELHHYLGGILTNLDCQPIIVGGVEDHVHLLSALARTCDAAEMVKEIKRGSSLWIKTKGPDLRDFAWQSGYGIFSIGFSQIEPVRQYIARQEEHHRKVTFQDEFRTLLVRYEIKYDERYVWD